ncbi:MAG: ECF transporter S component [Blautia sp.]|nr:ECF transporter S component [Blautia sp.]
MNKQLKTSQITMLGLMIAILLLMAYTPLGYLNIGPLAITFNMIPVAISAITLGPVGGAIAGAVFGMTSFLQCIGIGGTSAMGAMLFSINPILAFIQRFIPRLLDGLLLGYIFQGLRKKTKNIYASCAVTGFFSAFLNTLFFMTLLVVLFGNTEYIQGLMGGKNVIVFICTFVGVNAICEMLSATIVTGAVGAALYKARLLPGAEKKTVAKAEA